MRFAALFLVYALGMHSGASQTIPSTAYSDLHWRLVGPFRAGRSIAAAGIPGDPYTFYFGGVDGGMWKTSNAGWTWEPISDGQQMNPSIGAIAIAPSDPRIMYVGTGEADLRSNNTHGDGMYKSSDGGDHWRHIGLEDSRHIGKVLVDPKNPDIVLVAALGHAYGPNDERGVYRTTDGGEHWTRVLHKNADVGAIDLAWDEQNPSVVYSSLWEVRRTAWSQYPPNQGPGGGLYKSTDKGLTWTEIAGPGSKPYGRIGIAVVPGSRGDTVYVLLEAAKNGTGLYRSDDGGGKWTLCSQDPNVTSRMWYFAGITIDPNHPSTVYVPNRSLMRSRDRGKTFEAIKGSPGGDDYHFLWIDPHNSDRMIVASDQGTVVSVNGGATWSSWYNQPTGQFYHVTTDNQFPYRIYGSQQDAGTACVSSRSDFGLITFRDWAPVGGGEAGYIAPDPVDGNIVYCGDTYGTVYRFDRTTGQSQVISPSLVSSFSTPAPQRKYRFTWTSPIVFDSHDPKSLYMGSNVLLRTSDGGLHWEQISPDLSGVVDSLRGKSGALTVEDASQRGWGVIYSIASSPLRPGLLWVGTDDGFIHRTTDGGAHWENVTPPELRRWSKISIIEASPFDEGTAYAAVDRHRLDDFAPYIYRTSDGGKHWTMITKGIPGGAFVRCVRSDLKRRGLLYAGTETGVCVSFDDGDHWQSLQLNLPLAAVRDLAVHDNDLVAGTHGRAFWVLDDLSPLQQLDPMVPATDVYLFRPDDAIRIRRSVVHDTPIPPEEPHGTNPPTGVVIDYYLREGVSGPLTIDIHDAKGNLVRHYSSDPVPQEFSDVYFMKQWLPAADQLATGPGHHRFVWDLRYEPPLCTRTDYQGWVIGGSGVNQNPQGPLVLPGVYAVTLSAQGMTLTRNVRVSMDPRVKTADADLEEQLLLAADVWNSIAEVHALTDAMDTLSHRLTANARGLDSAAVIRNLLKGVDSLSLPESGLASLMTDILSADRRPTAQMYEALHSYQAGLTKAKERWKTVVLEDLAKVNTFIKAHGKPGITIRTTAAPRLSVAGAPHQ